VGAGVYPEVIYFSFTMAMLRVYYGLGTASISAQSFLPVKERLNLT
jgi:hypothetical protein